MNDDKLLALVGEAVAAGAPPADSVEAAYAAYGWRTLETDLALALLVDDAEPEVVGFHHGPPGHRVLTFQSPIGTIEVGIGGDHLEVTAQPRPGRVVLSRPDTTGPGVELLLNPDGRATATGLQGPVRVEVSWPGATVVTPWFTL